MQLTFMALLLAHMLDDFAFRLKRTEGTRSNRLWPLIRHGIAYGILAWACLLIFSPTHFFAISSQIVVVAYVAVHLLIGAFKRLIFARKSALDNWKTFLSDQALHVIVLTIAAAILTGNSIIALTRNMQLSPDVKTHLLEAATVYVGIVFGGGYLIRYLTRGIAIDDYACASPNLKNAGLYVGWLERFLIITAIAMQSPVLVGLIMTGKSIARFPEFKEPRFAEYFLIGTFLSVTLSVLGGILLLQLLYGTILLK